MTKLLLLAPIFAVPLIGAAPATTPTPQEFKRAMISTHNAARAEVGTPALTWDLTLAEASQKWAAKLAEKGALQHDSARGPVGENLASGTGTAFTPAQLVGLWVAEKSSFVNNPIPNAGVGGAVTGHYTQVVWRNTTRVGCGMAMGGTTVYLVCRYSPPGNFTGQRAF